MPHPYAHAYVCGRKDTPHSQAHYPPTPSQVPGETSPPWRRAGRSARVHNLSHLPSGGGVWPISRGGEISIFLNFCFLFSLIFVFSLNRGAVTNSPLLLSRGPPMPRTCKEQKRAKVEWSSPPHSTVQEEERDRARAGPGPSSAEPYPAAEVGGGPPRARGSGGPTRGRLFPALATSGGRTVGRAGKNALIDPHGRTDFDSRSRESME